MQCNTGVKPADGLFGAAHFQQSRGIMPPGEGAGDLPIFMKGKEINKRGSIGEPARPSVRPPWDAAAGCCTAAGRDNECGGMRQHDMGHYCRGCTAGASARATRELAVSDSARSLCIRKSG